MRKKLLAWGTGALTLWCAGSAQASGVISGTPISTGAPFINNVFHTAQAGHDGQAGAIIAWFDMNDGGGYWDSESGAFSLNVDIFRNSADAIAHTNVVGAASATGTLPLANIEGDGGLLGTIAWDFDTSATSFDPRLQDVTLYFEDSTYGQTGANDWDPDAGLLTLWGSSGWNATTQDLEPGPNNIGMDLVASITAVPVPAAVWLFGGALLSLVGISRRSDSLSSAQSSPA